MLTILCFLFGFHNPAHRINKSTIEDTLKSLDIASVQCYICGPPPMIASMETYLQELGVKKEQWHCEKWW